MIFLKILFTVVIFSSSLSAQKVYEIPFASNGNIIQLDVENKIKTNAENILIKIEEWPDWINFGFEDVRLASDKEKARFSFSVAENAKINEVTSLQFTLTKNGQLLGEKRIEIKVAPPKEFILYQNYPNPFNPSTTIKYSVPVIRNKKTAAVKLIVYDVLGREVTMLVNKKQKPGSYKVNFNAANLSSGTYFYRLISNDISITKKFLLLK